mmetsp:Transcript_36610/g.92065  ORF Transcript_36610/g.92065 Transcript_36610/m.92065 type:complete len:108 (+) Transcript_36610:220-543(+)
MQTLLLRGGSKNVKKNANLPSCDKHLPQPRHTNMTHLTLLPPEVLHKCCPKSHQNMLRLALCSDTMPATLTIAFSTACSYVPQQLRLSIVGRALHVGRVSAHTCSIL